MWILVKINKDKYINSMIYNKILSLLYQTTLILKLKNNNKF